MSEHLNMPSICSNITIFCLIIFDAWTDILLLKNYKRTYLKLNQTVVVEKPEVDENLETKVIDLEKVGLYTESIKQMFDLDGPLMSPTPMSEMCPDCQVAMSEFRDYLASIKGNKSVKPSEFFARHLVMMEKLFWGELKEAFEYGDLADDFFDNCNEVVTTYLDNYVKKWLPIEKIEEIKAQWKNTIQNGLAWLEHQQKYYEVVICKSV